MKKTLRLGPDPPVLSIRESTAIYAEPIREQAHSGYAYCGLLITHSHRFALLNQTVSHCPTPKRNQKHDKP